MATRLYNDVAERFLAALEEAANHIADQGFPAVHDVAPFIALEAKMSLARIAASR